MRSIPLPDFMTRAKRELMLSAVFFDFFAGAIVTPAVSIGLRQDDSYGAPVFLTMMSKVFCVVPVCVRTNP